MQKIITLPNLGDDVEEAEIAQWFVKEGDLVTEDTPLVEVLIEKASIELTAEYSGKVEKILKEEGSVVSIGENIAIMEV